MIAALTRLFRKQPRPAPTASEKLIQMLRSIDRMGGEGRPARRETLAQINDLDRPCVDRQVLAELTGVSEEQLATILRDHMRNGGTRAACIGLISLYLDD